MDPASSSEDEASSSGEEEVRGIKGDENDRSISGDDDDSSTPGDDEERDVPKSFDDLPSDDSVDLSSSDDEDSDDEDEEDVAVGERISAKRRGLTDQKPALMNKADAKRKALGIASERLAALRKRKRSSRSKVDSDGFLQEEDNSSSDSDRDERPLSGKSPVEQTSSKKKKKSKHKPTEASSKRSDFFARGAPDLNSSGIGVAVGANRYKSRDPRFQSLSGHFDQDMFEKKYSFLEDAQDKEIQSLKTRVAAWKKKGRGGQKARRKLGLTNGSSSLEDDQTELNLMMQKVAERRKDQRQRSAKRVVKKKIREDVSEGKRGAYYLKRSEQKRLEVEAEFDELRKQGGSGAVDKAIAKRRKKKSAKDKRFLPRKG